MTMSSTTLINKDKNFRTKFDCCIDLGTLNKADIENIVSQLRQLGFVYKFAVDIADIIENRV